jgi:hypothetical protein
MPFKNLSAVNVLDLVELATEVPNPAPVEEDPHFGPRVVPAEVSRFLARLRLLEGVPFAYLAPDADLLPRESIRFFYVDRAWTDALVQGALSVGTVNSSDRAELQALYPIVRAEVDEEERRVRLPGGEAVQQGPAGPITGFLLRSRAISGWPGVHVRAYREELNQADDATLPESDPRRVKLLRMERLAPAVLLVLFDGIPAVVHIEEPRQGVQFGVRLLPTATSNEFQGGINARNALTTENVNPDQSVMVPVPFRSGAPGVLDLTRLNASLMATPGTNMGTEVDGAEFALQMLRFPYRQVFGDPNAATPAPPVQDVFKPTIALSLLKSRFAVAVQS